MKCPKCESPELRSRRVRNSDVILYSCPKCMGIWFRNGQMEQVLPGAAKGLSVPFVAELGTRKCPDCIRPMHQFYYPRTMVRIDMCEKCLGLWIDAGEAREISMVRRALGSEAGQCPEGSSVKDRLIYLVDKALGWAMDA